MKDVLEPRHHLVHPPGRDEARGFELLLQPLHAQDGLVASLLVCGVLLLHGSVGEVHEPADSRKQAKCVRRRSCTRAPTASA